jgi:hypothetical protein
MDEGYLYGFVPIAADLCDFSGSAGIIFLKLDKKQF